MQQSAVCSCLFYACVLHCCSGPFRGHHMPPTDQKRVHNLVFSYQAALLSVSAP